jgi:hypothetical protein
MENNSSINPFDLDKWRGEALDIGGKIGFGGMELDAFRHIYTNAMTAFTYGPAAGAGYTGLLGTGYELFGLSVSLVTDMVQSTAELLGVTISEEHRIDFGEQTLSSIMDVHNNVIGSMIGSAATSKEAIISQTESAIRSGWAITSLEQVKEILLSKKSTPSTSNSFVSGSGTWENSTSSAGSFDTSFILKALGNRSGKSSTSQALAMSAAAFAQQVIKSRRRSLENDLLDIFTGGNAKTTLPQVGSSNPLGSFTNSFGGLIDNLVGSAMSRRKTRVSTAESERSMEASHNWNVSRSQQQAMLAQWVNQGSRNN